MARGMLQARACGRIAASSFSHHVARCDDVARALRQASDDQDEALRAERRGFVDRPPVIVDGGRAPSRIGGREHAAAAIAGHPKTVRLDRAHRFVEAYGGHLIAPRINSPNAMPDAGLHGLNQIPLLAHGGEINGKSVDAHGETRAGCVVCASRMPRT